MGQRVRSYIRQLREAQGKSTHDLARKAGCTASMISVVEIGKRGISLPLLYKVISALNGDMNHALTLWALDAGVPGEALKRTTAR